MISEKTVELNLTMELINFAWTSTGVVHFALAPSQRMEGRVGYDTRVLANGIGVFIQYKRAYVSGTHWRWHLNRTALKDQHLRLQGLEAAGNAVYYALPFFHLATEVEMNRRRLLRCTFWRKPSQINPPGGSTGHHDIHFDSSMQRWWVTSDQEHELPPPDEVEDVFHNLATEAHQLNKLLTDFNHIVLDGRDQDDESSTLLDDLVLSNSALARR
jgi:hypothetical protein